MASINEHGVCGKWGTSLMADGKKLMIYCNQKPIHDGDCFYRTSRNTIIPITLE